MKLLTALIIAFIFTSYKTVAQTRSVVSLKKEIDNYQKEDTVKINMLYDYGRQIFQSDLLESKNYIDRGIQLSNKINQPSFAARGNLMLSFCYDQESKNDSSVMVLLAGLNLSERYQLEKYLPVFYNSLGENYRILGNNKLAEFYDNSYLNFAASKKDSAMTLEALSNFITLYDDNGQDEKLNK